VNKSATTLAVGRILHYLPAAQDFTLNIEDHHQPMVAQCVLVKSDTVGCFNVIDHHGQHHFRRDVPVLQDISEHTVTQDACVWMPYQRAVAAGDEKPNQHA
jgi:hypothetical protein